jgi:hypothetical protein
MDIQIRYQSDGTPGFSLEPFTLKESQAGLVPQVGDLVTNGQTTKMVEGRVFRFRDTDVTITLICVNPPRTE